ncbi:MAG: hypothetical protein PHC88_03685 [Terrimicrobiaceae bacterium]|nr:hypothetical protein [Terrimicrobiaceae bacterium]
MNPVPLLILLAVLMLVPARAQEDEIPAERASKPPVAITFTPPDLDGRIALGIFDAAGRLVRTLRFEPGSSDLKVDTNGYIATWDGRDERGTACGAGRYSARGYVVGADVKVEGEAFHFNDWMAEDRIPATWVKLCRWPNALGVEIETSAAPVFAKIRSDGALDIATSPPAAGPEGARWMILDDHGQKVVVQVGREGEPERALRVAKDEPQPVEVLASPTEDAILLRETGPGGVERVRLLRRNASRPAETKDGKVVADWEVVFERTLQPCANFGIADGKLVADAGTVPPADSLTVSLVGNALQPGKTSLRFKAIATNPGSALVSPEGIELIEVSAAGGWKRFALAGGAGAGEAKIFQGDGIVVEEFALRQLDRVAAFDAGSFLLAPAAQ